MISPDELHQLIAKEERLQWWNNTINIVNVSLVALTFFVTLMSNRLGVWLNAATEARTTREKQISDQKIADSYRQAQTARATAEESKVEQQKLSIEARQIQIDLADAKRRQAEAERKQAEAQLKLEAIRKSQMPRVLTIQQTDILIKMLSSVPMCELRIEINSTNDEILNYGNQVIKCFKDAGWNLPDSAIYHVTTLGGSSEGIIIAVNSIGNPPSASTFAKSLKEAKIPFRVELNPTIDPKKFELFIGNKPQPQL